MLAADLDVGDLFWRSTDELCIRVKLSHAVTLSTTIDPTRLYAMTDDYMIVEISPFEQVELK